MNSLLDLLNDEEEEELDENMNHCLMYAASEEAETLDTAKRTLINKDGSLSKIRRLNFDRGPRREKVGDPWQVAAWLILFKDPETADPTTRNGKLFRRKFRVPHPVFLKMVQMAHDTEEPVFNQPVKHITGEY